MTDEKKDLTIEKYFTGENKGKDVYALFDWEKRNIQIKDSKGKIIYMERIWKSLLTGVSRL